MEVIHLLQIRVSVHGGRQERCIHYASHILFGCILYDFTYLTAAGSFLVVMYILISARFLSRWRL